MSVRAITWAFSQSLPSTTKLVLVALADYADSHGKCWPGQTSIASKCGLTDRAVRTHLEVLKAAGLIEVEYRRDARGRPVVSRYTVHFQYDENEPIHRNIVPLLPEQYSGTYISEPSLTSTNTGGAADAASTTRPPDSLSADWCPDASVEIDDAETDETIILQGDWAISPECYALWASLFPKLDIDHELDRAAAWYRDNPRRHKRRVRKFLTNWLGRAHAEMLRRNQRQPLYPSKPSPQVRH